jgi:hypothetical protein
MTFREQLMKFLEPDPKRHFEHKPEPGDIEKYDLNPKLAETVEVCTFGVSTVLFQFDAEGNLLDIDTMLVDDASALRDIAERSGLDEEHASILLCSADHIDEEDGAATTPPADKKYLN